MPRAPRTVLVTGASSGIGEATARRLAADGHRVLAGARRTDRLAGLAEELRRSGVDIETSALDVTDRDSVEAFARRGLERFGSIDVLVNNAGVMPLSLLEELRVQEWDRMLDVNVRGVLYGIAAVLPVMRRQGSGHVVTVSSVAGHRVDPTAAVYSATKSAVRSISEGLRQESRTIRVTVVSPGFTRSELTRSGGNDDVQAGVRAMVDELAIPPSAVADAIAYAIDQPAEVDVNEIVVRPTRQT